MKSRQLFNFSPLLRCGCHTNRNSRLIAQTLEVQRIQDVIDAQPIVQVTQQYNLPRPVVQYFRVYCPFLNRVLCPAEFGTELGRFRGVPAFSCHYESADPKEYPDHESYIHREVIKFPPSSKGGCKRDRPVRIWVGYKHQCVCCARIFLIREYGLTFESIPMAYHIFELEHFLRFVDVEKKSKGAKEHDEDQIVYEKVPVLKVRNGEVPKDPTVLESGLHKRPLPGNVLLWKCGGFFSHTGHVAIVTEVVEKLQTEEDIKNGRKNFGVRVWEQNYDDEPWGGREYSRELPAHQIGGEDGPFWISETVGIQSEVLGWMATKCMIEHEKRLLAEKKGNVLKEINL